MLGAVVLHDPRLGLPLVFDRVHVLPRVHDARAVGRNLRLPDALPVEIMLGGQQRGRPGLLAVKRHATDDGNHESDSKTFHGEPLSCTGGGAPPPAPQRGCRVGDPAPPRTDADTAPPDSPSSGAVWPQASCTGGGAPPPAPRRGCRVGDPAPPRTDADTAPPDSPSSGAVWPQASCTGGGAPPPAPRRGCRVGDPAPPRTDADTAPPDSPSS